METLSFFAGPCMSGLWILCPKTASDPFARPSASHGRRHTGLARRRRALIRGYADQAHREQIGLPTHKTLAVGPLGRRPPRWRRISQRPPPPPPPPRAVPGPAAAPATARPPHFCPPGGGGGALWRSESTLRATFTCHPRQAARLCRGPDPHPAPSHARPLGAREGPLSRVSRSREWPGPRRRHSATAARPGAAGPAAAPRPAG